MGFVNTSPQDEYRIASMASQDPTLELPGPSATEGLAGAIPKAIVSGLDKLNSAATDFESTNFGSWALGGLTFHGLLQQTAQQAKDLERTDENLKAIRAWSATAFDPKQTGAVGRTAASVAEGLTVAAPGAVTAGPWGAAALLSSTYGHAEYLHAKQEGNDDATAAERAGISAFTSGLGALLPVKFSGGALVSIGKSAAANVALSAAGRFATSTVLAANGYKDQADQYRVFDAEAMTADAILGAAFGAFARLHPEHAPNPADVDAAAAVASEDHFNRSAPGVPVDPATANAHVDLMRQSLDDLVFGRDVRVDAETAQRVVDNVVPDPIHPTGDFIREAAREQVPGFKEVEAPIPRQELPPPAELAAEQLPPRAASVDDFHNDMLAHLARTVPDARLPYTLPDGTVKEMTPAELADQLHTEQSETAHISRLHDVAAACFLRTGGAA